ncbi:hypothetical protein PN472_10350 [Microcystis aeruginosa CS-1036]|uniref:hypothetical protein n=1 Tax=Microcystis TaxID=1125 RepID=UPI00232EB2B0|nr:MULTISPECIES: hypothetical protein [Microcystis]MDB9404634.1 hypothetical protein [Microcystis sp. CS-574]MDB9543539.1 hypothetical protein [Microcystis aeruginosa CS-1036]
MQKVFSPLDRLQGGLIGAYIGESLHNQPLIPVFNYEATPRTTLLLQALQSQEDLPIAIASRQQSESALLFVLLPEILTWPDHGERWQARLNFWLKKGLISELTRQEAIIWGEAVGMLLQGKRPLNQLIGQLLTINPKNKLLEQIKSALRQNHPLESILSAWAKDSSPLGIAITASLYTFLQTSEDFAVSVRRANSSPYQRQLTTTLAGIWAGLYNGIEGIPLAWRQNLPKESVKQQLIDKAGEIYRISLGVSPHLVLSPHTAVAYGGTIQPRPSLKLVSQDNN